MTNDPKDALARIAGKETEFKPTTYINIDKVQAELLFELVNKASVPAMVARDFANLYDEVKRAAKDLGVKTE